MFTSVSTCRSVRWARWGLAAALVAVALTLPAQPTAQTGYTLETLPSPATDVNDNGEVVGQWIGPNGSRGYLWTQATGAEPIVTDPAIINRFPCSAPKINENGVVVAQGAGGTSCGQAPSAARYRSGFGLELGNTSGGDSGQIAKAVNGAGTAVGASSGNNTQPFVWTLGGLLLVPFPFNVPFGAGGVANDVDDAGVVVGRCSGDIFSGCPGRDHAFWWQNDVRTVLPNAPGHLTANHEALAINNNGQIVGRYSDSGGVFGAFLSTITSTPATTIDLLAPQGSIASMDINDDGDIVATINPPGGGGVLYLYRNGVWTDINTLRPPGSTLQLSTAVAINNLGWIVGSAGLSGGQGYVLIPPPVDSAPTASDSTETTLEDTPVSGTLSATDPNGDTLTYTILTNGVRGSALITNGETGAFTYTPNANESGTDTFTFMASDNALDSNEATVTVTITPVNDAPEASDSAFPAIEDTPTSATFQATDVDGPTLTFSIVANGSIGTAVITNAATGAFTYTPHLNANGPDTVTFQASDSTLSSNVGTFTLNIAPVNDVPVASDGSLAVTEDVAATGSFAGSDVDSASLTFAIVTNGSRGTATITNAATGAFTYTPNSGANGPDSVTFQVSDGSLTSNVGTVSVSISAVNDAPIASPQNITTPEDTAALITLSGTDIDGDAVTLTVLTPPGRGTLRGTVPNLTYTPARNYAGADSFTFTASDGTLTSTVATVAITVTPSNDAPVAYGHSPYVVEDVPAQVRLEGVDADGGALTFTVISQPSHGTLTGAAPHLTYTPDVNFNGTDTFEFIVADSAVQSNQAVMTLNVLPKVWLPGGPSGGGLVTALAAAPATLYAGTGGGGIFRSTDGGAIWAPRSFGLTHSSVNTLAVDPITSTTLYAGTNGGDGLYRSTDGGATWSPHNTGLPVAGVNTIAIDPTSPATMYTAVVFGTTGGVYKTTTAGANWTLSSTGLPSSPARVLVIDPVTPTTLYVGTNAGLFRSADGGATWVIRNTGLTSFVVALAIDPVTPTTLYAGTNGGVFKSVDAGGTWVPINAGLPSFFSTRVLVIDPSAPNTIYVGSGGASVYKSTNGGATWTVVGTGLPNTSVNALMIDPGTPGTLLIGSGGGVHRSPDGGATWVPLNNGLTNIRVPSIALDPVTPTTLFAGTSVGIFRSTDAAATWLPRNGGLPMERFANVVTIDPTTPTTLYAGISNQGVYKSVDSGQNWTARNVGLPSPSNLRVSALAIDPTTPQTVYAGSFLGVHLSTDGGATWVTRSTGLPATPDVTSLAIVPATPSTLYAGTGGGGVFRTTDGGVTWTARNTGLPLNVRSLIIDPASAGTLYAATSIGVYRTTDGGANWESRRVGLPFGTVHALAINGLTPTTLYAGMDSGFLWSIDSGATWATFNTGLTSLSVSALAVASSAPQTVYAGTGQGGLFVLHQAANDAPIASDATLTTTEDAPASGTLNAADPDGDPLTFAIAANGSLGNAVIVNPATGAFTYTPNLGVTGIDTITFTASDGTASSNVATVTVTIEAINGAPVAADGVLSVTEDVPASGTFEATDGDSAALTFSIVTNGSLGSAIVTDPATGAFTYTPNANRSGTDTFTFQASDGSLTSNVGTIAVAIAAVNDPPVAADGALAVTEDVTATGAFSADDVDSPTLTFSIVANGARGTATITDAATGAFSYVPNAHANGSDTFTFQASDGAFTSNVGTIAVTIAAVNDAPVASNGTLAVTEDLVATGTFAGSDLDGPTLTFAIVGNGSSGTATITNTATGAFSYTPNANANGPDAVTFQVNDGALTSNVATVAIAIAAVDDAPTAQNGILSVAAGGTASGSLVGTDIDSSSLTFTIVTNSARGTAVVTNAATGAYTYSANAGPSGTDTFTFQVNDGTSNSNLGTITVTISSANQPPVAVNSSLTTQEDRSVTGTLVATDPERARLAFSIASAPTRGTVTITNVSTGRFTYLPNANSNGVDSFTFRASDGALSSNPATVTLTVTPVNDAPTVVDQSLTTTMNQPVSGIVQGVDVDGAALTYEVTRAPRRGTLSLDPATGAFVYTPNQNFRGKDTFTFRASDGATLSNTGTVTVTVGP